MVRNSHIELQVGETAWPKRLRLIILLIALLSLILAHTAPVFRLLAIAALILTAAFVYLRMNQRENIRALRLYHDGAVTLLSRSDVEAPGVLESGAWTTRWFSILPIGRFDRWPRQHLLISRSNNHPDNYRHMLQYLRLGIGTGAGDGILGRK